MNKYILSILKKMAKSSDSRQTEAWTESKMQMISILTKKIQKIKVDQHFKDVEVNDFQMGIHSSVSWFRLLTIQRNIFPDRSNGVLSSIPRMKETKNAIKFQLTCLAFSFWSSFHWDSFSAFYLHQKMNMKKWL